MPLFLLHQPLVLLHPLEVTHQKLDLFADLPWHCVWHELSFCADTELLIVDGLLLIKPVQLNDPVIYHLLRHLCILPLVKQYLHEEFVSFLGNDAQRDRVELAVQAAVVEMLGLGTSTHKVHNLHHIEAEGAVDRLRTFVLEGRRLRLLINRET